MQELAGKTAIVTGASRGIGAAAAQHLAELGAQVVAVARSGDSLDSLVGGIADSGGEAIAMPGDVSDYSDVDRIVGLTLERFGSIDMLVNNAGVIEPIARLEDSDPEAWARAIDINLSGAYFCLRACLPTMLGQGSGVIVNISSGAATSALEGWSHYCASKAGLLSLTRCAHNELSAKGIRVVGLSPGTVATEMQVKIRQSGINPVSRFDPNVHIPPEWVARAIAYLCTKDAAQFDGGDFSLRDPENRKRLGLS